MYRYINVVHSFIHGFKLQHVTSTLSNMSKQCPLVSNWKSTNNRWTFSARDTINGWMVDSYVLGNFQFGKYGC